jgi:DNA-binding helix-hairpin-helix protein with protein kinase domain
MGIVHGDIRDSNVLVCRKGTVTTIYIIDVDNFAARGVSKPFCLGDLLYLAPELSMAMKERRPACPDLYTDRFAHGVLMHEVVLLKHPASGHDDTEEMFDRAMYGGQWIHDPAAPTRADAGGYPTTVLNSRVANLFRRFLSKERADRPAPAEWRDELLPVLGQVFVCPACKGPSMIDSSKWSCPLCKRPYPTLKLVAPGGRVVPLDAGCVRVGRGTLGGSPRVSTLHAIFRRVGPEVWVESIGRNGTYRQAEGRMVRIPDGKSVLIQAGDILRLADVEVRITHDAVAVRR